ncbi:hypothetical protein J1N35_044457 [Gossypium stocksii]|uniref:Uncharacterized protein n=1 Tax=Gossypium stocksii TaxID=47602 RepID=A0A9D3U9I9_9ROSI|nr:hypothetical protein J1N35_044457 [Gossypium stocksii]
MSTHVPTPILSSMLISMPESMPTYLGFVTSYNYSSIVLRTPTMSLFYRGGSSVRPSSHGVEDTQW